jgi:hypothetical protein
VRTLLKMHFAPSPNTSGSGKLPKIDAKWLNSVSDYQIFPMLRKRGAFLDPLVFWHRPNRLSGFFKWWNQICHENIQKYWSVASLSSGTIY